MEQRSRQSDLTSDLDDMIVMIENFPQNQCEIYSISRDRETELVSRGLLENTNPFEEGFRS